MSENKTTFWTKNPRLAIWLEWILETLAFILLPLLVYLMCYWFVGRALSEIKTLPIWMFMSIILCGDIGRKLIRYYQRFRAFDRKLKRTFAAIILGIVISTVLLVFSILSIEFPDSSTPKNLGTIQIVVFSVILLVTMFLNLWIRIDSEDLDETTKLIHKNESSDNASYRKI